MLHEALVLPLRHAAWAVRWCSAAAHQQQEREEEQLARKLASCAVRLMSTHPAALTLLNACLCNSCRLQRVLLARLCHDRSAHASVRALRLLAKDYYRALVASRLRAALPAELKDAEMAR